MNSQFTILHSPFQATGLARLSPRAFEEEEHEEGVDEVDLFLGRQISQLFDGEFTFEKCRLLAYTHDGCAIGAGGDVSWVEKVAREESQNGDAAKNSIHDLSPGVFLLHFEIGHLITRVKYIIAGAPDGAHTLATYGPDAVSLVVGEEIAGRPVEHFVRFDAGDLAGFRLIGEYLNVLLELKELLFDIANRASLCVVDKYLGCQGDDFEAEVQWVVHWDG